jgi:osmotically-inducible protein OsmY
MDDVILRHDIVVELDRAPNVDSASIGVAVVDGIATLSGHVRTCAQRSAIEAAARRARGLMGMAVEIEVRPSGPASQ